MIVQTQETAKLHTSYQRCKEMEENEVEGGQVGKLGLLHDLAHQLHPTFLHDHLEHVDERVREVSKVGQARNVAERLEADQREGGH